MILKPWKKRGRGESVEDVIDKLMAIANREQQEGIFFAANPPSIPGLGMTSGLSMQILDINSLGVSALQNAVKDFEQKMQDSGHFKSVNSTFTGGVAQYRIKVDRDRASMHKLAVQDIYSAISAYTGGAYAGDFVEFGRTFQVTARADGDARRNVEDLQNISVRNSDGQMVPFGAFASVERELGESTVSRYNMYETASVTAIPADGYSTSLAISEMQKLLQESVGTNFSYAWTGIAYQQTTASTTISTVFIFAIIMTILVLAAQYESWTDPLAVVMAMPVAVLGCLLGYFFLGLDVDIYTQIGLILLLGMAAKNAILIVEYAMDFRKAGVPVRKAAHDAGTIRFRPIMMTALAFIFGVMPMLFATGAGAGSRKEIGSAIVFGMSVNAFLGTLFVPCFWALMQHFNEKYLSRMFRLPGNGNGAPPAAEAASPKPPASEPTASNI